MSFQDRLFFLIKILLPFLALVAFNAYPQNRAVENGLSRARLALSSDQHEAAARELRAVHEREPWRTALLEQIGREEFLAGRFDQAVVAFQGADAANALSLDGSYLLSESYLEQESYELALAEWEKILTRTGADTGLKSRVHERMLQYYRDQGDYQAATESLRAWNQLEPQNAQVAFLLGLHLSVEDPAQALHYLLDASRLDSTYTSTVQVLRRGFNLANGAEDPGYGWLMIGRSLGSANYWDLAEIAFEQAVQASPAYAEAWAFLGEARYQLHGEGKPELDRAGELNPQSTVVRALQALYWRRQGDLDQALALLEAVAREEPQEPVWPLEIANIYVEKGELETARDYFQQTISLAPQISLYWQNLARFSIQYDVDIRGLGLPAARQAVLLTPDDPAALDTLGWALVTLADYASGERFLQRSIEIDAAYSPALLHLGQLYIQQQDFERAQAYLQRAKQNAGDDQIGFIANRLLKRYFQSSD